MPEPSYLYGSHYSTPGFILYYLVRKVKKIEGKSLLSSSLRASVRTRNLMDRFAYDISF